MLFSTLKMCDLVVICCKITHFAYDIKENRVFYCETVPFCVFGGMTKTNLFAFALDLSLYL